MPVSMRRFRPATRTMKNSSRLFAKIAAKLARSMIGRSSSWASSRTRLLNFSQLNSRSKKRSFGNGSSPGLKLTLVVFIGLGDMLSYLAAQDRLRGCVKNLCHTFLLYP